MESMSKLNDTNIKQSCRTCLIIDAEEMISIFDKIDQVENDENTKTRICDMLMDVALIELDRKENFPTLICTNCLGLVQLLFNFRKQCNRSQAILLEYITEKENKETLGTKENPNQQDVKILNEKSANKDLIDVNTYLNKAAPESIILENDLHVLSHSASFDNSLNEIKLEIGDEIIIKSETESETEKEDKIIEILGTKKSPNHDSNIFSKRSKIKETITNDVDELSNPSSSDDTSNASIKLKFDDEIIKSDTTSECEETLNSKINYNYVLNCQLCDKSFKSEALYFTHMKQHAETKYVCNKCNASFNNHRSLNAHMKKHAEEELLVCSICSVKFEYRRDLKIHMKEHPHVCDICGKYFERRKYLLAHLNTHKNEKSYSCKICGKKYKRAAGVALHMRLHTGQKPFLCSICGTRFHYDSTLKTHMRTHTKEKPHMCNVCGKTMSARYNFLQHMKRHTGEKPFKCTECDKRFLSSIDVKRHAVVHRGFKPYSCDVCQKQFKRKKTLSIHEKIHTDDKPHECLICGKKFIQAHCLRIHLKNHVD